MGTAAGWSHETVLAAEPVSARLAREFVVLHLAEHHLAHLVDAVRLVASELATNALLHAQTPFSATLSSAPRSVLLAVRDQSPAGLHPASPQPLDEGGRGLFLVELLSDDWGTSTDGRGFKSVWAAFSTHAA